jgi:signal transduction histidine kinase
MVKRRLIIILPLIALLVFLSVQVFMIVSIWRQEKENMLMRYQSLTREAAARLMAGKKANGFEKAMDVTDKFAGLVIKGKLPELTKAADTADLRKKVLTQTYSILQKNEVLSSSTKEYIRKNGYSTNYKSFIWISYLSLLTDGGQFIITDTVPDKAEIAKTVIVVESYREEHNNFVIEYVSLIDMTELGSLVFKKAFFSFLLIILSVLIVFLVFWITWRNLIEERRLSGLKSDFINNMTHELKTPLSTITVAGRTLEKAQINSDPEKVLETAKMISKQSVNLNQLINTILEVSLLERTEFELDRQKVSVDELTHQIVASFLTSCDGCAVVKEDYKVTGTSLSVDIVYFTTMVNNLLTNAVKYCDKDPVVLVSTATDNNYFHLTITDNGIGIPHEHTDHIFDKFYRVPYGNIHKTKGLGLGLYYVKRIATAHGGDVSVSSRPGRGSTFKIRLPL